MFLKLILIILIIKINRLINESNNEMNKVNAVLISNVTMNQLINESHQYNHQIPLNKSKHFVDDKNLDLYLNSNDHFINNTGNNNNNELFTDNDRENIHLAEKNDNIVKIDVPKVIPLLKNRNVKNQPEKVPNTWTLVFITIFILFIVIASCIIFVNQINKEYDDDNDESTKTFQLTDPKQILQYPIRQALIIRTLLFQFAPGLPCPANSDQLSDNTETTTTNTTTITIPNLDQNNDNDNLSNNNNNNTINDETNLKMNVLVENGDDVAMKRLQNNKFDYINCNIKTIKCHIQNYKIN